jgi:hypothetical protein
VWSWNIEAVDDGEQELEATLYVLLFLDGEKPIASASTVLFKRLA